MKLFLCILINFFLIHKDGKAIEVATTLPPEVSTILNKVGDDARRIINGDEITDELPYMVYLKLAPHDPKERDYRSWLCGGAIIHEEYILTSAACIEDANHFYIVSGTFSYADDADRHNNVCIKNGAKKAIWKCIPKNYVFDGHENDNVRWMNNDIAVVKIEDGFDFTRRIRGCDFIPKPICYNNQSQSLENPGNIALIAGWGSIERYHEYREVQNNQQLLDSLVEIISKDRCKRRWGHRYHNIIDNYMICSKDLGQTMTEVCNEKYVDCRDISYDDDEMLRRGIKVTKTEKIPTNLTMHSAYHNETFTRRLRGGSGSGGFCENDHGGPMVVGSGVNSILIGVISACLVKERTNHCYGPFLYTSIFKNRQFLSCVIYKNVEPKCRRQFRSGETHEEYSMSWKNHPDGPAITELGADVKPPPRLYETTPSTSKRNHTKLHPKHRTTGTPHKTKLPKADKSTNIKLRTAGTSTEANPIVAHPFMRIGKPAMANEKTTNKPAKHNVKTTGRPVKRNQKSTDQPAKQNVKTIGKSAKNNLKAKSQSAKDNLETTRKPAKALGKLIKDNIKATGKPTKAHKLTIGNIANIHRIMKAHKPANVTYVKKNKTRGDH